MEVNNLKINEIADILASEASLLNCTLEEAWNGIHPNVTNQFCYKEVESYIFENIEQCNF